MAVSLAKKNGNEGAVVTANDNIVYPIFVEITYGCGPWIVANIIKLRHLKRSVAIASQNPDLIGHNLNNDHIQVSIVVEIGVLYVIDYFRCCNGIDGCRALIMRRVGCE
nr:hypothetical protein [Cohnella fermenti]